MVAGIVCTKIIFLEAVNAPYIPAIATHERKKSEMFVFHSGFEMKKLQINPAARKPLYKPWFAAMALVGLNKSFENPRNTFGPLDSHANISNQSM